MNKLLMFVLASLLLTISSPADDKLDKLKAIYDREKAKIEELYRSDMDDVNQIYLTRQIGRASCRERV